MDQQYYDRAIEWISENCSELPDDLFDKKIDEVAKELYELDVALPRLASYARF